MSLFDTPLKYRISLKIMILSILVFLFFWISKSWWNQKYEGMSEPSPLTKIQGGTKYVLSTNPYTDPYYVDLYDTLHLPQTYIPDEIKWVLDVTHATPEKSVIMDVGSGTGTALNTLLQQGYTNSYGIDMSDKMIIYAEKKYPQVKHHCKHADVTEDPMMFDHEIFTHILCMDRTIYDIPDKSSFFRYSYTWLKPGGILALHLVDVNTYDPRPLLSYKNNIVQPRFEDIFKNESTRKRDIPRIELPGNVYYSMKNLEKSRSCKVELFEDKEAGIKRQVEHTLNMESADKIIELAKEHGFIPTSYTRVHENDRGQWLILLERKL